MRAEGSGVTPLRAAASRATLEMVVETHREDKHITVPGKTGGTRGEAVARVLRLVGRVAAREV